MEKRKKIRIGCGILTAAAAAAAVMLSISGLEWRKKQLAVKMNSAAMSCLRTTDELLRTQDEENPLLPDGIYSAEFSPSEKKLTYYTADGTEATACSADFSDRSLYFMAQIEDGQTMQVSACRKKDVLTEENLLTRQEREPFPQMSFSEYWQNRFIGYAPVNQP